MIKIVTMVGLLASIVGAYQLGDTLLGFSLNGVTAFFSLAGGVSLMWLTQRWEEHVMVAEAEREKRRQEELEKRQIEFYRLVLELKKAGFTDMAEQAANEDKESNGVVH